MRNFNFGAGPAQLPESVLIQAQRELLDWHSGMSVMEWGHRTKPIEQLFLDLASDLRDLLTIPDNFEVLYIQGGARAQFSAVPLNLLPENAPCQYFVSGHWSALAMKEAQKYSPVTLVADGKIDNYCSIPDKSTWNINPEAVYCHYTDNETIEGVVFTETPIIQQGYLVADMTSSILSKPIIDWDKFGVIYASAQKNIGIAGMAVVIVRKDLMGHARAYTPGILDYQQTANNHSMYNTPPVFCCYMAHLMTQWVKQQGGVSAMAELAKQRSQKLYQFIDNSDFYINDVSPEYRSLINIPFFINNKDAALEKMFVSEAASQGLMQLQGHRVKGGMRVSLYNAMPVAGVEKLVNFMQHFERDHR